TVPKIGSSTEQEYNQIDLASIIEPRLEEIMDLAGKELYHAGYKDLPGGFVLTGGIVAMPGVLELAEDIFQHHVRVAIPDYIGVREPQYTTAVGLIQFTYRNVKVQGKEVAAAVAPDGMEPHPKKNKPPKKQRSPEGPGVGRKMKDLFNSFFE
ncbi:MAG TPA: cell division FtsA domain-containing protein, partial [Bacillales bacterium]|nr:cell division FtsA domain-containing protein [Bacillales bacterium]